MNYLPTVGTSPILVRETVNGSNMISQAFRSNPRSIIRTVMVYGETATNITAGSSCTLTSFRKDFDDTNIDALNFCTVDANVVTITRPGYYALRYHVSAQIQTAFVGPADVDTTTAKFYLKVGGTSIAGTNGYISATDVLNLNGFLKTDGAELTQNVSGLVMETAVLTTESFGICDALQSTYFDGGGSGSPSVTTTNTACAAAITDAQLVGGKLISTVQAGTSDVTSNATVASDLTGPEGFTGSASGATLILIKYNSSNELKFFVGETEYDPTVVVFGSQDSGSRDITNTNTTLEIQKLS